MNKVDEKYLKSVGKNIVKAHKQMNQLLLSRYRKKATTEDELIDDRELANELGWAVDEDFEGLETVSSDYDLGVKLKRDEFIHFD